MTGRFNTEGPVCSYRRTGHNPELGARRLESLTGREREVLLMLGTGLGNRELAQELGIAERTVKAHIASIVEKTKQQTRTQAAILAALAHDELCSDSACARHVAKSLDQGQKSSAA
ncbi:helix-turn-helix transcriptional regulator [Streptomyces sp. NPDC086549]|uniref:helix-turn-helix domain-containing protein n=1 Tax=Streptomyces sp. NPDC086549 TaxID=3365752 RepID=UPI003823FA61